MHVLVLFVFKNEQQFVPVSWESCRNAAFMWLSQNLITVLAQSFFSSQAADETDQKKNLTKKKTQLPGWQFDSVPYDKSCCPNPQCPAAAIKPWMCLFFGPNCGSKPCVWERSGGTCNWSEANENLNNPRLFLFCFLVWQPAVHWTGLQKGLRVNQQARKQFSAHWPLIPP